MPDSDPSSLSIFHRLRFLARDSLIYGGAVTVNAAFGLITFPLLSRHFSVADYGLISFFSAASTLLGILFVFGQDSAVARFFYQYKDDQIRRQIVSQSLCFQLMFVVLLFPVLWFSARSLSATLPDSLGAEGLLKLVLLQVPFLVFFSFAQNLLKWTFARRPFLIISVGSVGLNVLCVVYAITYLDISVEGIFKISLAVQLTFGILGMYFVRGWLVLPRDFTFLRELVPFAVPLGVICVIGAFVPALERLLVSSVLGSHELGLYAAGAVVSTLIALARNAFQTAWGPLALAIHQEPNAAATYNWVLKGFSLGLCLGVLFLSAVSDPLIALLASTKYDGASVVVFPLAMGLAVQAVGGITEIGIGLSKRSYLALHGYAVYLLATGAAVYGLATMYGLSGAAFGVMVGNVARTMIASWLSWRAYRLPWAFQPVLLIMSGTIALGLVGAWASTAGWGNVSSAIYAAGLVIVTISGWFVLFNSAERRLILSRIRATSVRLTGT